MVNFDLRRFGGPGFPAESSQELLNEAESKIKTERKLQVAFAAAARATTFRKDLAEGGKVGRVKADVGGAAATSVSAPVWMVPQVVSLRAKLDANAFFNGDSLEKTDVPVLKTRLVN